jgi:hypothetical protein
MGPRRVMSRDCCSTPSPLHLHVDPHTGQYLIYPLLLKLRFVMNSISSNVAKGAEKKDAIRRQIALLQAQLGEADSASTAAPSSPPRKRSAANVLAPATPSPSMPLLI